VLDNYKILQNIQKSLHYLILAPIIIRITFLNNERFMFYIREVYTSWIE